MRHGPVQRRRRRPSPLRHRHIHLNAARQHRQRVILLPISNISISSVSLSMRFNWACFRRTRDQIVRVICIVMFFFFLETFFRFSVDFYLL